MCYFFMSPTSKGMISVFSVIYVIIAHRWCVMAGSNVICHVSHGHTACITSCVRIRHYADKHLLNMLYIA